MRRPLYGWLVADAVSLTGTRISMVAIPLFVLATTGSAALTGVIALAESLPLVLSKLLAGPIIDSVGPRRVALTCQFASVPVVALPPVLFDVGLLPFWLFAVIVAVAGALRGPGDGAVNALAPSLAEHAQVPIERTTGLSGTVERTASMLGAGVGGLLVAVTGPANALLIDAASFGVAALVLSWATVGLPRVAPPPAEPVPYRRQLHEGWRFLRADRVLLAIALMVALTNLLDAGWSQVLMPVWSVDGHGGARTLGLVFALFSGASAVGALLAALYAHRLSRFWLYVGGFLLAGLPRFVVFAVPAPLVAVLAVLVVGGFASGFINPVISAIELERIPRELIGRVSTLVTAMAWSLLPLGGLLGGLATDGWGLGVSLLVFGAAYFAVTMAPVLDPSWRELDRRPDPAGTGNPADPADVTAAA